MHWLAQVLSDYPYEDLLRDVLPEDAPRPVSAVTRSWTRVPASEVAASSPYRPRGATSLAQVETSLS